MSSGGAGLVPGPHLEGDGGIRFVAEPDGEGGPHRVWYHLRDFGDDPQFVEERGSRVARIPAPPVDRIEYLLADLGDGVETLRPDPANAVRVAGPFGDKSVLELPAYVAPRWVCHAVPAAWERADLHSPLDDAVAGQLCAPVGHPADAAAPLLVVHDGPEYERLCRLLDYLAWRGDPTAAGPRVLLLAPADRNAQYSANDAYALALVEGLLPAVRAAVPTTSVVGLGASLGALALLHAATTDPAAFTGLLLQSGSFFLPRYDAHEGAFPHYDDLVGFVARLDPAPLRPVRVALTSGLGEENLENNRALAGRLADGGVTVTLTEGRDGHNHVAWRDLLHPALDTLLRT